MSQQIKLEIIEDKVVVTSPYHTEFVNRCRRLRGKWSNETWIFDDSILEYVREAMIECFNTTGETPYQNVNLLVKDVDLSEYRAPVNLFGRTIARAWGRDSGAKIGDGIVLIKGEIGSGGSVKNWSTNVIDATFQIQNFPEPSLELPDVKKAIEEGWAEVKLITKKRDPSVIKSEIHKLEERLSQLKKELGHEN